MYVLSSGEFTKVEPLIRAYLLSHGDTVRYSNYHDGLSLGCLFFLPVVIVQRKPSKDPEFIETLKGLEQDFIRKESTNTRYNNIPQGRKRNNRHYFYRLSTSMKQLINKTTLLLNPYGMADPTFYKNGEMIGCTISHEPVQVLYLTDEERMALNAHGVIFEPTEEDNGID